MRIIRKNICFLAVISVLLTSCLSSNDDDTTLYSDAAISSFTLGTLNKYEHLTSSTGSDSIIKSTITGSDYTMRIDQVSRRIYNADSLPIGTDVSHVVCTVSALNNGLILIKDMASDTLRYYSSTDSIDFSQPRTFRILSSDGTGTNDYVVSVNVHQEESEEFVWTQMDNSWTPPVADVPVLPAGIKQLLGGCTSEQYALSDDNMLMVSRDGGVTWQEDLLDADAALLPTQDLAIVSYPLNMAESTDQVVLVGNRSADNYPQEEIAMVWRKIVDYSGYAGEARWVYMEQAENPVMALPRLADLTIVKYDDGILALGGAGIGGCTKTAYSQIYQSRDNGITWKRNALYQLPDGFDSNATKVEASVDEQNCLWLHCHGTGQVWRGRLNRLGWNE